MDDQQSLIRHPRETIVSSAPGVDVPPVTLVDIPKGEERLLAYLRALQRHRALVVGTILTAVVVTLTYTISRPDVYEARAQLLLEAGAPNVVTFTPVNDEWATSDYYASQYEILRSRTLAERTIDALGLWTREEFGGSEGEGAGLSREARAGVVRRFLARLTVAQVRQSSIAEIRFRSGDPALAADAANALASEYIEQNIEAQARPNVSAASSLVKLIEEQKKAVQASEEALQRYREQRGTVSLDQNQNIVVQRMVQLSAAVTTARTEKIQQLTLYEQLRSIEQNRAPLDSLPAVLSNSFIQGLKSELAALQRREAEQSKQLGDLHPDMIQLRGAIATAEAKLRAEVANVAQSVQREYAAAEARERALAQDLAGQERQVLALDRTSIAYGNLQREAATNRQIYETLLQRAKETELVSSVHDANVRVVDPAEIPQVPLSKGTVLYSLLAILWGGALGVGLALGREVVDSGWIKSPEDIRRYLGMQYIGLAPEVPHSTGLPLVHHNVTPAFKEAIRTVGATLAGSSRGLSGSILVTSATTGEGKTLIASTLATSLAKSGRRVLLVDADLRRPQMHHVLGTDRENGLADLLRGTAKLAAVIKDSPTPGLWLITAGKPGEKGADLIGSDRFRQLIKTLSEGFDCIVVDGPPVLAVGDTAYIAKAVSSVVLVVRAHTTKLAAVQAAIERLATLNAAPVGVVLNRADLRRNADLYYPYYAPENEEYYGYGSAPPRSA